MSLSRIEEEAKNLLLQRRESLRRESQPPPSGPSPRWNDWESTPSPLGEEERRELAAVDEALRRIAEGRYGTCLACGGPLGLQRIRAIPEARYCIACSGTRAAAD
jgi:RNA polymerase-binding transcription factor DksA